MLTPRPLRGTHPHTAVRQAAGRLRRLAAVTCALLASAAIVPAASARLLIPNDGGPAVPAPAIRVVTVGGIPGWQITVIAAGAALAAALAAVVLDRARAGRKAASATPALTRPVWPRAWQPRLDPRSGPRRGAARQPEAAMAPVPDLPSPREARTAWSAGRNRITKPDGYRAADGPDRTASCCGQTGP